MAGSWGSVSVGKGQFGGQKFKSIEAEWTGDSSTGAVPTLTITNTSGLENLSGLLLGVRVLFDGTDTPAECDIKVTDKDGIDLLGGAASSTNKLTASGKVSLSPPEAFLQTIYVVIATAAGNASKKAKVVLYVIN